MIDIVRRAAERVGGVPALAREIGVSRQALYQWTRIPAGKVGSLSRATGLSERLLRPDLFDADRPLDPAYGSDFAAWAMDQAGKLRRGDLDALDLENLSEEIDDLARSDRREIESRLTVLLKHLLKMRFQPGSWSRSWESTVLEQRARIGRIIAASPSLRSYPAEVLVTEHHLARQQAAIETGLPPERFPAECPFGIEEILDLDFLPRPAAER